VIITCKARRIFLRLEEYILGLAENIVIEIYVSWM
jgi:hypothetical protein